MPAPVKKQVTIYTDGGCEGNPGPGGWAAVLMHGEHRKEINGGDPATTNNRMELMAAIEALRALKMPCTVALHTDSQYVKNGITQWIKGWKAKGWKTASREPVKNAELWRALDAEVARHEVSWHWVKGHAGHEHNERCDVLAGEAIAAIKKQYTRAERRQLLEAQAEEKRGETLL